MDQNVNLTAKQVADRLCCSERTLARLRAAASGPPWFKHGSKVLYPLHGIEKYEQVQTAFYCPQTCEKSK